jgi:hypothetical protein
MSETDQKETRPRVEDPDPLIDEIRAIRRAICDEVGNDVEKFAQSPWLFF